MTIIIRNGHILLAEKSRACWSSLSGRVEFRYIEGYESAPVFVRQMFPPLWHRFTFLTFSSFLLMLSRICFLIFPIYCFDGLINLHIGLFSKLSLWSFKVMKVSFVAVISTRSSIRSFSVIVLLCRQFCLIGCSLYFCRFLWCCHAGAYCTLWLPICRSSWIYWPIKIGCCHFQLISCLH